MQLYPKLNTRSVILAALRVTLLTYVLFGAVLYFRQDTLLYFPDQTPFAECDDIGDAERLVMSGTRGYFFQNGTSTKLAVLYHGNAGRACDRDYYQSALTHAGYSWLLVEYTGYAGDGAMPTTAKLLEDAARVAAWTKKQNFSEVAIIGESIGVGPASYHAYRGGADKLILITPFERLSAVVRDYYPMYPARLLLRNDFAISHWAARAQNVFIIYGAQDTLIPARHAIALFGALPQDRKQFLSVDHEHNDVPALGETQIAIMRYLMDQQ